jgi:hypothetical protein
MNLQAHEYLLMCVHIHNEGIPLVWVRTERQHLERAIISSPPSSPPDIIKFSHDRSKLWKAGNDDIMATTFAALNFRHVIDLLNIVHLFIFPFSWDAMWYATVVMGMLHGGFGKSWAKPPPPDWVKIALNLFAKDMPRTTRAVQHQFAIQHPKTKRVSLMKPGTWENESAPPSQPPNSIQYLREPQPARSTNPNSDVSTDRANAKKNTGGQRRGRKPKTRPAPGIDPSNVLGSKTPELLTPYDPHSPSVSRTGSPLSNQTDEEKPMQPESSTPTPARMSPKGSSTEIHEATSILPDVMITAPSAEAFGRDPHAGTQSQTDDPGLGLVVDKAVPSIVNAEKMTQGSPRQRQQKIPGSNFASNSTLSMDIIPVSEAATEHTNPSFTNAEPSPPEASNLTGRIVRLGSTPMAIGGYSSVWKGALLSTPSEDPDRALQVFFQVIGPEKHMC